MMMSIFEDSCVVMTAVCLVLEAEWRGLRTRLWLWLTPLRAGSGWHRQSHGPVLASHSQLRPAEPEPGVMAPV